VSQTHRKRGGQKGELIEKCSHEKRTSVTAKKATHKFRVGGSKKGRPSERLEGKKGVANRMYKAFRTKDLRTKKKKGWQEVTTLLEGSRIKGAKNQHKRQSPKSRAPGKKAQKNKIRA